jgi:hypothetical protein
LPPPRKEALETLYRNGDPEAFFGVADVGRYDELFEGKAILDFFGCCLSTIRECAPYCCFLNIAE